MKSLNVWLVHATRPTTSLPPVPATSRLVLCTQFFCTATAIMLPQNALTILHRLSNACSTLEHKWIGSQYSRTVLKFLHFLQRRLRTFACVTIYVNVNDMNPPPKQSHRICRTLDTCRHLLSPPHARFRSVKTMWRLKPKQEVLFYAFFGYFRNFGLCLRFAETGFLPIQAVCYYLHEDHL